MWKALLQLVIEASIINPDVRYVGWDVGISPTGPVLIEANVISPGIIAIQHPVITGEQQIGEKFRDILDGLP
jgi:glutathione synthase/RimK-type ligase-like ATP-grasp enzyme